MTDTSTHTGSGALARAAKEIAARLAEGARAAVDAGNQRLLRVELPLDDAVCPFDWFASQDQTPRLYWADRDVDREIAAVGAADVVSVDDGGAQDALRQVACRLADADANLRYFGGLAFDPESTGYSHWAGFGRGRFVLPRIELRREGDTGFLACNVALDGPAPEDEIDKARGALTALCEKGASSASLPPSWPELVRRDDRPGLDLWTRGVAGVLTSINAGSIEKVVLARESLFQFAEELDPALLLARLARNAVHTFRFCFALDRTAAFLGATPERLYRRTGRHIETEALAGTRPRGAAESDTALGDELLHDDKERREHRIVVDGIRSALSGLCNRLDVEPDVSLVRLSECQHLFERVTGDLRDGVTDADVLDALHPTPAVGGCPTQAALNQIAALEPFDRGWYAGPIGWVGRDATEFAVALRSGLVRDDRLRAYAGAGIVAGSDPRREWDEIENKLSIFLEAIEGRST